MQEDLEHRTVTLVVNSSKFTGRTLKAAIRGFLRFAKHQVQKHHNVKPKGKQSVKKLIGQNAGVSDAELGDDANIKAFDRVARKYGVDYAVKRVEKEGKTQYHIFFKARDSDAIMSAMTEYTGRWKSQGKEERPSVRKMLATFRELLAGKDTDRAKNKEISR